MARGQENLGVCVPVSNTHVKAGVVTCTWNPREKRSLRLPGHPTSGKATSSRFSERPCLGGVRQRQSKREVLTRGQRPCSLLRPPTRIHHTYKDQNTEEQPKSKACLLYHYSPTLSRPGCIPKGCSVADILMFHVSGNCIYIQEIFNFQTLYEISLGMSLQPMNRDSRKFYDFEDESWGIIFNDFTASCQLYLNMINEHTVGSHRKVPTLLFVPRVFLHRANHRTCISFSECLSLFYNNIYRLISQCQGF